MDLDAEIANLINLPLDSTLFSRDSSAEWIDSVEHHCRSGKRNSRASTRPYSESLLHHIYRRLGHLSVNPGDHIQTSALIGVYVIPQREKTDTFTANNTEADLDRFNKWVIDNAAHTREVALTPRPGMIDQARFYPKCLLLFGDRGCGKTFFLNYYFSRFSSIFDDKKILWIRINLPMDYGFGDKIIDWIYAQIAKVILRYYDPYSSRYSNNSKTSPIDAYNHLCAYAENDKKEGKPFFFERKHDQIAAASLAFQKKDDPIGPELCPTWIGQELSHYAIILGYSIVVVLDGLDQLDATLDAKTRHDKLANACLRLINSTQDLGLFFVLVMRTTSLDSLDNSDHNPFGRAMPLKLKIEDPPLQNIVQKRLDYLIKEIPLFQGHPDWHVADWQQHIEDFKEYLNRVQMDGQQSVEYLENIYSSNRRAQMQAVQMIYHEYLRWKKEHPYLLVECLMKAGWDLPPRYYKYSLAANGKNILRNIAPEFQNFDYKFFPSIFTHPYISGPAEKAKRYKPQEGSILHGFRILQFLIAFAELKRMNCDGELYCEDICHLCKAYYEYDPEITRLMLEEYHEYEIIRMYGDLDEEARMTAKVRILEKGEKIYRYATGEIAYLNLASMRVLLPEYIHTCESAAKQPIFMVAHLGKKGNEELMSWVQAKAYNAIQMIRIIAKVNEEQRKYSKKVPLPTDPRIGAVVTRADVMGRFTFIEESKQKIKAQVYGAITNKELFGDNDAREKILNKIDAAVRVWTK